MTAEPVSSESAVASRSTSPRQHQAPLFIRDRYGSHDSTSTLDEVEPHPIFLIDAEKQVDQFDQSADLPTPTPARMAAVAAAAAKAERDREQPDADHTAGNELPRRDLLPADRGREAWKVLGGTFAFEALFWGFPLSFGVFQSYYFSHDSSSGDPDPYPNPFQGSTALPVVGVLATGMLYLGAPVMSVVIERWLGLRRILIAVGWLVSVLSLIAASFARSVPVLALTQGVMYSTGVAILYLPLMSFLNEWFVERRGLAYGIVTAATGLSGAGIPFLAGWLLTRYGAPNTLRIFAAVIGIPTLPFLLLLKPRITSLPPSTYVASPKLSIASIFSFFRAPLFHFYSIANTFHAFAFFLPSFFLPLYYNSLLSTSSSSSSNSSAPSIFLDSQDPKAALLLAILSLAQSVGQLLFGYLSDHPSLIPLHFLLFASPFVSGVGVFALWGPAQSLAPLAAFAALYGFSASGLVVLWARMGTALDVSSSSSPKGRAATLETKAGCCTSQSTGGEAGAIDVPQSGKQQQQPSTSLALPPHNPALASFAIFGFQKGVASIVAGPISTALLKATGITGNIGPVALGSYGLGRYIGIITFTGSCMLTSSLVVIIWHLLPRRFRGKA